MGVDLGVKTPCEGQADAVASEYKLFNHGISGLRKVYWNLPEEALYEESIFRKESRITKFGALAVNTGKHTARAAKDKFVVKEPSTEADIWWSEHNKPFSAQKFNDVLMRLQAYLQGRDVFVQDVNVGQDENHSMPIRIITQYAWHSIFARNMFVTIDNHEQLRKHIPEFTIISIPSFKAVPAMDTTGSETFILLNFAKRLAIIGGTGYAGEIKKSVFTVMNYLLPKKDIFTAHCSANVNPNNPEDVALFFGLSGTGKTTLSADPTRNLIGDDEHGWSEDGVFNFEGGCYAKVIQLSPEGEPEIYAATQMFGTILENVIFDPVTRILDLDDDEITENTRCSYPLEAIPNVQPGAQAGHAKNIVLLTCDANGVLPPISKLTPDQAIYHFISGYTSKVGGTEIGLGEEPEVTFSACFGAPFMSHHPYKYATMLKQRMIEHNANCWLVNTGWTGGPYGIGKRMRLSHTRAMLNAALEGKLEKVKFKKDPVFGFEVPTECPDVPAEVLDPQSTWTDKKAFENKRKQLAQLFIENFKRFLDVVPEEFIKEGPQIKTK
ncbi:MAG: phosphoenolpyruvate carboxykinase (ATP) [Candidatus Heimdallarchaeota archaeon]|nr:phosphoenolpyruvate carboxykinase (ATP) [Candidatus Heimdallarchaeota archaeon]